MNIVCKPERWIFFKTWREN